MTTENADVRAVVGVNAVGVRNVQIVENADFGNQHIVAARRVQCPKRRVGYSNVLKRNVVAFFHINDSRARIKIAGHIILVLAFYKAVAVCVNHTFAGYRTAVRFKAVKKYK